MSGQIARDETAYGLTSSHLAPAPELSDASLELLRGLATDARRGVASVSRTNEEATRVAAQAVAGDAHRRSVTAEHMLIAVKREWSALPEVRDLGRGVEARALLDRLVTHCIDAFYQRR